MCFPKPKVVVAPPQESESANQAAAQARVNAEEAKRKEVEERANTKREEISVALDRKTEKGRGGKGVGRRSLYSSTGGGQGYLSRFD